MLITITINNNNNNNNNNKKTGFELELGTSPFNIKI
jgi:hypothetical protein